MPLNPFRKKPARPEHRAVPITRVRPPASTYFPDMATYMGAFEEDALDLEDALDARDRSEESRHG